MKVVSTAVAWHCVVVAEDPILGVIKVNARDPTRAFETIVRNEMIFVVVATILSLHHVGWIDSTIRRELASVCSTI